LLKIFVAKSRGFAYFSRQMHRVVPGKEDLPRGATGAKQEKSKQNKLNNIGGTR